MNITCPVCGGNEVACSQVLWPELTSDWQLSPMEVAYIDRQQGCVCVTCGNNVRSMSLAAAILRSYQFDGTLQEFVRSEMAAKLQVLEINPAGGLSGVLADLPGHRLVSYPDYDMTRLAFSDRQFDLIIHSDTLEHVPHPQVGLAECRRVIAPGGRCIFTVPIIVGRLSRSRDGLKKSFHGCSGSEADDFVVHTEFGADIWCQAMEVGFREVRMHNFDYPAGIAIEVME